jgi:hypothetical protein
MRRLIPILVLVAPAAAGSPAHAEPNREDRLLPKLEAIAATGNAEALYHLGMIRHLGLEGKRDPRAALALFRRAAAAGDPLAAYKLGCYYHGQGEGLVENDLDLALTHKMKAAQAGYALAQHDVAMLLYEKQQPQAALAWMSKAAAQGWPSSLSALASLYNVGRDIPQDRAKTLAYFKLSLSRAGKGASEAQRAWITNYERETTPADLRRAKAIVAEWRSRPTSLTLSARSGQEGAQQLIANAK